MKARAMNSGLLSNSIIRLAIGVGLLLLAPLVIMQFTDAVNWTLGDFVIAGALLFGAGLLYELGVKRVRSKDRRLYVTLALVFGVAWLWVELAVGLFTKWGS